MPTRKNAYAESALCLGCPPKAAPLKTRTLRSGNLAPRHFCDENPHTAPIRAPTKRESHTKADGGTAPATVAPLPMQAMRKARHWDAGYRRTLLKNKLFSRKRASGRGPAGNLFGARHPAASGHRSGGTAGPVPVGDPGRRHVAQPPSPIIRMSQIPGRPCPLLCRMDL